MSVPGLSGVEAFRLIGFDFDAARNVASLRYGYDDRHHFEEVVEFGGEPLGARAGAGLESALRLLHLAAGVSYYKAAAPGRVVVETGPLTEDERAFVTDLYDKGLREFAVSNNLAVPLAIDLVGPDSPGGGGMHPGERSAGHAFGLASDAPPPGIGVPVGGGKDSIVVVEALLEALRRSPRPPEQPVFLVAVNCHPAMERTAATAGRPLVSIRRRLSPKLLELNAAGALNGHVPVTAIVSLIAVTGGFVHGYDTTLMSLERSSDEATSVVDGVEVNHQWSKSAECELELRAVVRRSVSASIEYRSPLRSCGELEIARWFATLQRYHGGFRSCNRVFRGNREFDGWCGNCPKCRFVFLVLAPFLEPVRLEAIFGHNLLDDASQVEGFRDLFAAGRKPFECVGEQRESLLAFLLLLERPGWRDSTVVAALRPELERDRPLVASDLEGGRPALESADATRERVVAAVTGVISRVRPEPP